MRLTQIKLSGFKSFVDPTTIATPGQLVGIVGPNGCGKSNVIDAVRWVLGESKASALRGESMQDVIFNGAGERKPVGRASVELHFDNSQGRIGGQWGQYAEISIKRVLTRDGDSTYYINNIPVRRRDIHDLFLGTGLGPRAYAIIEQGMISRIIEAKPEELRIFLEEAAGVSKYKERRKETEGRLSDARENLARVEDIRQELGNQLVRLETQARVATEYRELEGRLKQSQHMLWFAKQQDAVRVREKCTTEMATLTVALESLQAELRAAESKLEALRTSHYTAGDALHEKQGGFYAANAEVTRLEQQLSFVRESESRLTQQVAQLTEALGAIAGQETRVGRRPRQRRARARSGADGARIRGRGRTHRAGTAARARGGGGPDVTDAGRTRAEDRVDRAGRARGRDPPRQHRASAEAAGIAAGAAAAGTGREFAHRRRIRCATSRTSSPWKRATSPASRPRWRRSRQRWSRCSCASARPPTHGSATARCWATSKRDRRRCRRCRRRSGTVRTSTAGWPITGSPRPADCGNRWTSSADGKTRSRPCCGSGSTRSNWRGWTMSAAGPTAARTRRRRIAAYAPVSARHAPHHDHDSLLAKVRLKQPEAGRLLADGLHGVRCRPDLASALADRDALGEGEAFVTPAGHLVTAQGVTFFAPDSELHGVIARQRELDELATLIATATTVAAAAREARDAVDEELKAKQQTWHAEGLAVGSQQRRVHDLELELVTLKQAAEAAERRRAQIAQETADVAAQESGETAQRDAISAQIADLQSRMHEEIAAREAARHTRNEAEVELARGRERVRAAERAAQEAGFAERSCRDRLAELERRRESLTAQAAQQQSLLAQFTTEQAAIDWTPVEEALQRQLALRGEAEQALAAARDHLESLTAELRAGDEARLVAEQKLEPARVKIQDMQLKEQAAALAEQQFTEQLTEAQADVATLPEALKAWGSARTLPAEIERIGTAIAELGAVNLAALDELAQTTERKDYLDRQAADLTEAMTTLESAIRQIDRESRDLLQQTFDSVNANFAKLFPTLFGGGQAGWC